ncbi:MATE family efflux transporter [Pseudoflavonifractor capillosus]|uniref:MATE family efflux transporter n=1 Tax=Pseudoflavonifractor capillosus TaxID=106588 RepID=UPI00195EA014|nr:MATE family efflux transporter [Pseudoflavonifractor capillosus]MBM6695086.1 MATE family efflux transporter [Pseudoflavonifractor capillosus]
MEKQLRRYLLPNILAMIGTSCYILADTFFISLSQGPNGITALNLVLPLYGLIFALGSMIGIGSATRYALGKGSNAPDYHLYFSNSIAWTLLVGAVFVALGVAVPDGVLRLMGADDTILQVGHNYIRIVLCFAPLFMLNFTCTAFVRNDGAPRIAMAATLLSGLFNILFDYLLMFPLGLGMTGAALATGFSPVVSMSICLLHYLSPRNTIRLIPTLPSLRRLLSACQLGVVAFVGEMSSGVTTMVFNFILLHLAGNAAVAAYGIVANIALVGVALFNGISQGLQPLASACHGSGDTQGQSRIYRHSMFIGLCVSAVVVAVVVTFAGTLVAVFNSQHSAQLADYAIPGLRLYFLGFLFAGANIVKSGFYSATGRGRESSILALCRGVVAIVAFAFLLSHLFGITGVWLAFPAAELFTLLLGLVLGRPQGLGAPDPRPA